jgi:uridine monophosphate synthetase
MTDKLILELCDKNCIRFGNFTLKDGSQSPIYIDLKNIISHPHIVNIILSLISKKVKKLYFNRVLGVPYGGLFVSSAFCSKYNYPMILLRKETKKYGLKKSIEGEFNDNDTCLVIEDTISTGSSTIEFINKLKPFNLIVNDIVVICDRRIRNKYDFENKNIHSLFTINDIVSVLYENNKIDNMLWNTLKTHFSGVKLNNYISDKSNINLIRINQILQRTTFCFEGSFKNVQDIFKLISFYKTQIAILKIYTEIIENLTLDDIKKLVSLSKKYNFLIFEGRVFDHNETQFFYQFTQKFNLNKWVHLIELSDLHSTKIFDVVDSINLKCSNKVSIVYKNFIYSHDKLLFRLNKQKNIIIVNEMNLDNEAIHMNTKRSKLRSDIIILGKQDYFINNNFVYVN